MCACVLKSLIGLDRMFQVLEISHRSKQLWHKQIIPHYVRQEIVLSYHFLNGQSKQSKHACTTMCMYNKIVLVLPFIMCSAFVVSRHHNSSHTFKVFSVCIYYQKLKIQSLASNPQYVHKFKLFENLKFSHLAP